METGRAAKADGVVEAKAQAAPTAEGQMAIESASVGTAGSASESGSAGGKHQRRSRAGRGVPSDALSGEPGASVEVGPGMDPALIAAKVEAILLSTDRPVAPGKIAEAIGGTSVGGSSGRSGGGVVSSGTVKLAVELLNEAYGATGRSFRIEPVSGGLRIMTRPEHADVLARFHGQRAQTRLSRAAIESLAIIAYKQPITRAEIESIRGVASGEILKTLMERRLVTITGRAEELGRPMLYGTTRQFLETFGLASLKDLPPPEEFGLQG